MFNLLRLSILCFLLVCSTFAQTENNDDILNDEELEDWKEPAKGHPGFFAAGGLFFHYIQPQLSSLNAEINLSGLPKFSNTLVLFGGQGFGTYKQFRIGGFGFGGTQSVSASIRDTLPNNSIATVSKTATIRASGVGLITGYRITLPNSFEMEPAIWLTFGTLQLKVQQSTGNPTWENIWRENQNASTNAIFRENTIYSRYIVAQPGCFIRYYPTVWSALGIGVQYSMAINDANKWKYHRETIQNAKTVKMTSPQYTFQILFGI